MIRGINASLWVHCLKQMMTNMIENNRKDTADSHWMLEQCGVNGGAV